ncbi:MAG: response regulator [Caulobacteraceae bacterium]
MPEDHDERAAAAAALGLRVLLAEDNPINALLARALLEREGCMVDRAQTGPQALEAALAARYDLILLDLRMPGMDGTAGPPPPCARAASTRPSPP